MVESWTVLAAFIGANVAAAASGAVFTPGRWYKELNKPSWTPPDWLFAPAWTILFAMIAWSGYAFYMAAEPGERLIPLIAYGAQLVFNFAWSALFFGAKRMDLALADAFLMLAAIAINIALFWPVSEQAALLLVPYLGWVAFAAALNFAMMRRNMHYAGRAA